MNGWMDKTKKSNGGRQYTLNVNFSPQTWLHTLKTHTTFTNTGHKHFSLYTCSLNKCY